MSLLDEIAEQPVRHRGSLCTVAAALASLDESKQAEVIEAIDSPYDAKQVSRVLRRHDINIGYYTISRHRRGDCRCRS